VGGTSLAVNGTIVNNTKTNINGQGLIWVGSNYSGASQLVGSFYSMTIYDEYLTSVQIAQLYTASASLITSGKRVDWLPINAGVYLVTGYVETDNYTLAADTASNFIVGMDIPGDAPAKTTMYYTATQGLNQNISLSDWRNTPMPELWFTDKGGTALTGAVGGSVEISAALTTTSDTFPAYTYAASTQGIVNTFDMQAKQWYVFTVMREATATNQTTLGRAYMSVGGQTIYSPWQSFTTTTELRLYRLGPIGPVEPLLASYELDNISMVIGAEVKRSSGTADMWVDYACVVPGNMRELYDADVTFSASVFMEGNNVSVADATYSWRYPRVLGDILEYVPNRYNVIVTQQGGNGTAYAKADGTVYRALITPRWSLL
jgi:hypothetical protein